MKPAAGVTKIEGYLLRTQNNLMWGFWKKQSHIPSQ